MNAPGPDGCGEGASARFAAAMTDLRLALSFLTVFPVGPRYTATPERLMASFAYFPLIGFLLGAGLVLEDRLLGLVFERAVTSALTVLVLAAVTGAVHLDGVADTADALGAGSNRARAMEIMRDSRIGSFGAVAVFFVLGLKIVALAELAGHRRWAALYLAPGLARWAMVAVSERMEYLRPVGAGTSLLAGARSGGLRAASAIALAGLLPVLYWPTAAAACAAAATVLALRGFYRRWLAGVTGDLIGAAGELVEVVVLLVMAA